jgi:hypothetical protein
MLEVAFWTRDVRTEIISSRRQAKILNIIIFWDIYDMSRGPEVEAQ